MKTLKSILFTLLICFSVQHISAQFGTSKKVVLPNSYAFEWILKMEMKNKQGSYIMEYFLKKDEKYFGFKNDMLAKANKGAKMFMVIDKERKMNVVFMSMMGQNIVQTTKMDDFNEDDEEDNENNIEKIGTKTILGYTCQGFKTVNGTREITFYITNEVPISFTQIWGFDKKSKPKGFNDKWMKYAENGLVMEMNFVDKKKPKYNTTMICTAIKKTEFSIDTTKYKSMF